MIDFSSFLSLNRRDFINGLAVAVLAALLGSVQQALTAHGLDLAAYDWAGIVQFAFGAGVTYLSKNLLTTKDGRVFGMFK